MILAMVGQSDLSNRTPYLFFVLFQQSRALIMTEIFPIGVSAIQITFYNIIYQYIHIYIDKSCVFYFILRILIYGLNLS